MRRRPDALATALAELESQSLRRRRITLRRDGAVGVHDGTRRYLNFSSNDYLGLASEPALAAGLCAAAQAAGAGSGASHLVTGHGPEHAALENELAEFTGRARALLFSTGYMANLGVVMALAGRGDLVLEDRLNHASLLDAALLSRAKLERYGHADAAAAAQRLAEFDVAEASHTALFVTDGVFSMDGDIAPLPALATAASRHEAWLVVDDAHGLGVLGERGGGVLEHHGLDAAAVPVLVGTLGKAFGSFGAFVAGDADLVEWLVQRARTYIYTTALPEPVAAATRAALRIVRTEPWRRARLRVTLSAAHSDADVDGLVAALARAFDTTQALAEPA